jgi:hypothetical protein
LRQSLVSAQVRDISSENINYVMIYIRISIKVRGLFPLKSASFVHALNPAHFVLTSPVHKQLQLHVSACAFAATRVNGESNANNIGFTSYSNVPKAHTV